MKGDALTSIPLHVIYRKMNVAGGNPPGFYFFCMYSSQ